jgi:hemolysin III
MGTANKAQAPAKAKLRGVSHIIAAFLSIPFGTGQSMSIEGILNSIHYNLFMSVGIRLISEASTPISRAACLVFALSTTCLFSISSIYHTPHWDPETRLMLRRWDHAAIYMLIAGTYTPFCALALDREEVNASYLLLLVWVGAILGIVHSIFNAGGFQSKMVSVALYIALGWIGIPVLSNIHDMFGPIVYTNLVAGGVCCICFLIYILNIRQYFKYKIH